jgi:hypothetical protein
MSKLAENAIENKVTAGSFADSKKRTSDKEVVNLWSYITLLVAGVVFEPTTFAL